MKKLLSISLLMCLAFFAKAQDITASFNGSTINPGDELQLKATGDELQFAPIFSNNGPQDICCRIQFDKLDESQTVCTSVCTGALCMTGSVSAPFIIQRFADYTEAHAEFYVPEDAPATRFKVTCYDTLNTSSKVEFYIKVYNSTVGIDQPVSDMRVNAYPNPATDIVNITFAPATNNSEVMLYNIAGKLVKEISVGEGQTSAMVSVSELPSGIYLYAIRNNNGLSTVKKLVVK